MQLTLLIKKFFETWKTPILVIGSIVFFAIVSKFAMDYYNKTQSDQKLADLANNQERPNDVTVYLFFADWCKHCIKARPAWESFMMQYNNKPYKDRRIVCNEIDCSDVTNNTNDELMKQFGVNSYPTILMIKDQKIVRFDASVTKDNLDEFVKKMI